MNPAETVIPRNVQKILDSDMARCLTEGFPGDKEYPRKRQNVNIDEIESPNKIASEVKSFLAYFQKIQFSFDV